MRSTNCKSPVDHSDCAADSTPNRFQIVSMFSGCGGMDLGFLGGFSSLGRRYKKLPFDIAWANDINKKACQTYTNNIGHEIRCGDVWNELSSLPETADVLIGGFPCQDISINGKGGGVEGLRSGLYRAMIKAIQIVRPKIFVAENVKSLLHSNNVDSLKRVLSDFSSLGYSVKYWVVQCAEYGVPQTRERVFFIGTIPECSNFVFPKPPLTSDKYISAKCAIGDLAEQSEDKAINHIWSKAKTSPEQGSRRLKAGRAGYTIRAECHGNIQFHYKLRRRISMREAARIQSFPDKFIFAGGLREIERQVGNAVPPVFAWHLANSIASHLRRHAIEFTEVSDEKCA